MQRRWKYILYSLLIVAFMLIPFTPITPQTNTQPSPTPNLSLPTLPKPLNDIGIIQTILNWLSNLTLHEFKFLIPKGSFTSNTSIAFPLIPSVQATQPKIGSGDLYPTISYVAPSVASFGTGYEYTTSFGVYDLLPIFGGRDYYVAYRTSDMGSGSNIVRAGFVLLENGSGSWQLISGVSTAPTVTVSSGQFQATWNVTKASVQIAQASLTVSFTQNKSPKISVTLAQTSDWATQGMKDYRWVWVIAPTVGYDQIVTYPEFTADCSQGTDANGDWINPACAGRPQPSTTTTLSTLPAAADGMSISIFNSNTHFVGLKAWHSDWSDASEVGVVQFSRVNLLTGSPAIIVLFAVNKAAIDPSIANDTSCTQSGSNAASINCSLNHAASVFIIAYCMINNTVTNGAAVSSVTVNGFSATGLTAGGSTTTLRLQPYVIWMAVAANDSVVCNYSGVTTNAEAMVVVSFTGTRNTSPLINSRITNSASSGTSVSLTPVAGETSRRLVQVIAITANAAITQGGSQTKIAEVDATNASVHVNYEDTGSSVALTGSWTGSTNHTEQTHALLPSGQVLTDASVNGLNATDTASITSATSGTIATITHAANSICVVAVGILNSSSQTVSSVVGATNGNYIQESTKVNGTTVSTDLWYIYDTGTATGTITISLSASANAVMAAACFGNAKGLQLFEGLATSADTSATASSTNVAGNNTANRRIIAAFSFATAGTPTGSQGIDLGGINANSIGIDLNYLDSSSTTNMQATDTSSAWAAIGVALLPFPINVDTSCTATGASAASNSCSLNHAANVLVVIFAGNDGVDTVSSITVGGNAATKELATAGGAPNANIELYYYYSTGAANDSVVVNWTTGNKNESEVAISFTGTRSTAPFFNASQQTTSAAATSVAIGSQNAGEINRVLVIGIETQATNTFVKTQSVAGTRNSYEVTQISGNSNSMDAFGHNTAANLTATVAWGTSARYAYIIAAILPAKQIVVDGNTGGGITGAQNVVATSSATVAAGTCSLSLPSHDANVLVVVQVTLVNALSQTVSSVKIGSTSFTKLTTIVSGTAISTDIWYLWDTVSGAETITGTFSANAAYECLVFAVANTVTSTPWFETTSTNSGSGTSASVAVSAGTANRRLLLASGYVINGTAVGSQGVDVTTVNDTLTSSGLNLYEQPSGAAYTMASTDTSATWVAIGTAILDAASNVANTASLSETGNYVDALGHTAGKIPSETIALIDTVTQHEPKSNHVLTEIVTQIETLTKGSGPTKFIETLNLVDALTRGLIASRCLCIITDNGETLNLIDSLTQHEPNSNHVLTDTLNVVSNGSQLFHTVGKPLSDNLNLSDLLSFKFIGVRTLSDALNIVDSLAHTAGKFPSDILNLTDSITQHEPKSNHILTDALNLTDVLAHTVGKFPSDTLNLVDLLSFKFVGSRSLSDILNLTDTLTRLRAIPKTLTDTLNLIDVLTFHFAGIGSGKISDTLNLTDSLTRLRNVPKSLSDTLNLVDSLAFKFIGSRSLSDTLNLVDSLTRLRNVPTSASDALNLTDNLSRYFAGIGSGKISDNLNLMDTLTRLRNVPKSIADTLNLTDTLTRYFAGIGVGKISDTLNLTDSLTRLRNVPKSLTDVLNLIDSLVVVHVTPGVALTDALNLVDSLSHTAGKIPSETLNLTDLLSLKFIGLRNFTDTLTLLELNAQGYVGNHTSGGNTNGCANCLSFIQITAPTDGNLISIGVYTGVNGNYQVTLYSDNGSNYPGNLLVGPSTCVEAANQFNSCTITYPVTSGTKYFLTLNNDTSGGYSYASGGCGAGCYEYFKTGVTYGSAFPNPAAAGYSTNGDTWKIFATISSSNLIIASGKPLFDILNLTDLVTQHEPSSNHVLADAINLVDSFAHTIGKYPTDSLILTDIVQLSNGKFLTDTLNLVGTLAHTAGKFPSETLTLTDSLSKGIGKPLTDAVNFVDTFTFRFVGSRSLTDTLNLTDTLTRIYSAQRGLQDTLNLIDTLTASKLRFFFASPSDTLNLLDTLSFQYVGSRSLSDVLKITETLTTLRSASASLLEVLTLTEQLSRFYAGTRNLTDTLNLLDVFHITSFNHHTTQYNTFLFDTLTLTDNLSSLYTPRTPGVINVSIADLLNLQDLLAQFNIPFGSSGGYVANPSPLVQLQLAANPRIATLDYLMAFPSSFQLFFFTPTSIVQMTFTALNGNRTADTLNVWYTVTRGGQPYQTTPKEQHVLNPNTPTNFSSWLLLQQMGTYQITANAEGTNQIVLPPQTVTIDIYQLWLATIILWGPLLFLASILTFMTYRSIRNRREDARRKEEEPPEE